ncbi:MAG TPA: DNA helicase PriA [Bacillota bacterium]|nr:DNA helicase PriA [Bacillota bacterium]
MSIKQYKCLSCKAGLKFDPPSQKWKCEYCFSEYEKEQLDSAQTIKEIPDEDMPELDAYHCNNCGADLLADDTTSATFCLYCKSPTVIKTRFSGRFKPRYVIPFRVTKPNAKEIYRKWIGKRIFAPTEFKHQEEIDKVTGIYAPYWLFDCKIDAMVEGEGRKIKTWRQGDYRITQTKYYSIMRSGDIGYEMIPVDASIKLSDELMELIEPYNYSDITDFSMQYMSGFMAERYDVESEDAGNAMKKRVERYAEDRLKTTINGYSSTTIKNKQVNFCEVVDNYAMLPVYLLVNKYKDKSHTFIINGQTGKVSGETPIDKKKQFLFAAGIFAATWIVAVFGGALFV